jgi:hypothetical protein
MEDGLAHRIGVESEVASFVARLDGERTLVEIMGAPGAGGPLSTDPARAKCLKTVRFLLERGFLLVPPGS